MPLVAQEVMGAQSAFAEGKLVSWAPLGSAGTDFLLLREVSFDHGVLFGRRLILLLMVVCPDKRFCVVAGGL